jgi:hypothetical protein
MLPGFLDHRNIILRRSRLFAFSHMARVELKRKLPVGPVRHPPLVASPDMADADRHFRLEAIRTLAGVSPRRRINALWDHLCKFFRALSEIEHWA